MRIAPNHPRLRIVAVACWALGAWLLLQPGMLTTLGHNQLLAVTITVAAVLMLTVGIVFWLLGTDRRAGVIFDGKGLALNLGHSAAFVSWDNIAAVGVSRHRTSLFALGSRDQIGIKLHRPAEYIQSYEARLPASRGLLARSLRVVQQLLKRGDAPAAPSLANLATLRQRTGYDLLIPEAQLGGRAAAFVELIDTYRLSPLNRRSLRIGQAASGA